MVLDDEEIGALREYVASGGSLYASKFSSLLGPDGARHADFPLSELFKVSLTGETESVVTYLQPSPAAGDLFGEFGGQYPMTLYDSQRAVLVRLLRSLCTKPLRFESDGPKCVEITMFDQPEHHRVIRPKAIRSPSARFLSPGHKAEIPRQEAADPPRRVTVSYRAPRLPT